MPTDLFEVREDLQPQANVSPGQSPTSLTPEFLAWVRGQTNEQAALEGLHELRRSGGLELADFIQDIEQRATPRE